MENRYFNFRENICSDSIEAIFPGWTPGQECVAVFGPHDDDPLIGAGYAMAAAMDAGAEVFAVIFCRGNYGYTRIEQKDTIEGIRRRETIAAYEKFGIPADHVLRFDYPDFGAANYIGYQLINGETGSLPRIVELVRARKITRVLIPNGYREHTDHTAVFNMAAFDVIQAGDPIMGDLGSAHAVKTILQYSVWSDFSPEDMLVAGMEKQGLRANRAMMCPPDVETRVQEAILEFSSQLETIGDLLASRKARFTGDGYIELYIAFDPRPKLDFSPYIRRVCELSNS
jgi:LmbE family N-acetylglucosaminyl deacetylase